MLSAVVITFTTLYHQLSTSESTVRIDTAVTDIRPVKIGTIFNKASFLFQICFFYFILVL